MATVSACYIPTVAHQLRAVQKYLSGAANDMRKNRRPVYQFPNSNKITYEIIYITPIARLLKNAQV